MKIIIFTELTAPCGCGQYFTSTEGTVKGFNADGPTETDNYLAGQNYAICIRRERGFCSVSLHIRSIINVQPAIEPGMVTYER